MRQDIAVFEYADKILEGLRKGALLTTKADGKVNTMTISWGTLGIEWNKPIFTVFVRQSRYTKTLLDKSEAFTLSIPYGAYDKDILAYCGKHSGRDTDKIKTLGLHTQEGVSVDVPVIKELALILECKVIYRQMQESEAIDKQCDALFYAKQTANEGDYHTAYYGEITAAYILQ